MKDKNVETTLKESKKLENYLNNDLLKRFVELHNVKPKHSKIHIKQEVVAKRGLFFDVKKRYALNITNLKGREVDEFDLKGIINRRSDYPSITKEKMLIILDLILKTETIPFEKINNICAEFREELMEMCKNGDKRIARPVSFARPLAEYINVPYQVMGMLLWNKLEYEYFVNGTRGYLFKIFGVDPLLAPESMHNKLYTLTKKNTNVVIPYEENFLPKYFNMDIESSIKFCWDDRVEEMLNPISGTLIKHIPNSDYVELAEW